MTRYVFDTNVIVSALLFNASKPGLAVLQAFDSGTILTSAELLTELNDVLSRPKFGEYIEPGERERFFGAFVREVRFVEIRETIRACRDPKDDQVLELAVNGKADFIITGDTDLLALSPFRGIAIPLGPAIWGGPSGRLYPKPGDLFQGCRFARERLRRLPCDLH